MALPYPGVMEILFMPGLLSIRTFLKHLNEFKFDASPESYPLGH